MSQRLTVTDGVPNCWQEECTDIYTKLAYYEGIFAIIGSPIFRPNEYNHENKMGDVIEWVVIYTKVFEDEVVYVDDSDNEFMADDIGKTVFLTREAAEQALAEWQAGKEGE